MAATITCPNCGETDMAVPVSIVYERKGNLEPLGIDINDDELAFVFAPPKEPETKTPNWEKAMEIWKKAYVCFHDHGFAELLEDDADALVFYKSKIGNPIQIAAHRFQEYLEQITKGLQ